MLSLLKKIFGTKDDREVARAQGIVDQINELEPSFEQLSDDQLREKTQHFKDKLADGYSMDEILVEAFAVVREAAKRTLGMRHYDVQMVGGIMLHEGKIAEMKTGEGKTLVATCPVYLNALGGKGVHIVTVNDYLAKRDRAWMGRVYEFLGLTTSVIYGNIREAERKEAYRADIVYGTNNEFGFDYLRDNMKPSLSMKVQRGLNYCIVDEVDSILIDEARTPLIISGAASESLSHYKQFAGVVKSLEKSRDYEVDLKANSIFVTEEGIDRVEKMLNIENLYSPEYVDWTHYLNQSLRAKELFKRDKDYIVKGGKVIIVDEFTGRLMDGRRYSEGLHQAIEAKENVRVASENQTLATITLQNYFRMYEKMAGMTGTAKTEEAEFVHIYNLPVVAIPTNKPLARNDRNDVIYGTKKEKFEAVAEKIEEVHKSGQPILVGTAAISTSEHLSSVLKKKGIKHSVLNAKFHEKEAEIISQAGRLGAVTIATNMAGRGTDILLGGNPDFLANLERASDEKKYEESLAKHKEECRIEKGKVLALGGLYILGTELHESRRIDNQLRGRSGRQGDPGESRFYISLEDELMEISGVKDRMDGMGSLAQYNEPIESSLISSAVEYMQTMLESRNFSIRKQLLEYDDVMNKQRTIVYSQRDRILGSSDLSSEVESLIKGAVKSRLSMVSQGDKRLEDAKELSLVFEKVFNHQISPSKIFDAISIDELAEEISRNLISKYNQKTESLEHSHKVENERNIMIDVTDGRWKENLKALDVLKESVSLQSYGQKDPVVEYKLAAFDLYQDMVKIIREEVSSYLIKMEI